MSIVFLSHLFPMLRRYAPMALLVGLATFGVAAHAQSAEVTTADPTSLSVPVNDWHILNDPAYDYTDLTLAHNLGYSDSERATIAKIARLTNLPFKRILSQVHQGETFGSLASDYGLRLSDVLDASDEQARIDEYLRLHQMLLSTHSESMMVTTTQAAEAEPTLAELEARYNQLNAAFPALPPTDIETTPIGTPEAASPTELPPAPIATAPVPQAPMRIADLIREDVHTTTMTIHTVHHFRHHRHHHAVRRHRHHKPAYMTHRGS